MLVNLPWGLFTYGPRIFQHRFDLLPVLHFMDGFQMLTESAYLFPASGVCTRSDYIPSSAPLRHLWLHLVNFSDMPGQIYHECRNLGHSFLGLFFGGCFLGGERSGRSSPEELTTRLLFLGTRSLGLPITSDSTSSLESGAESWPVEMWRFRGASESGPVIMCLSGGDFKKTHKLNKGVNMYVYNVKLIKWKIYLPDRSRCPFQRQDLGWQCKALSV